MSDRTDRTDRTDRALSFGPVAEAYERFRPGYSPELVDRVLEYADQPVRTALEIGAGTGKATRLFAGRGIEVTATEPDGAMLAELRGHVPAGVRTVRSAFEDLRPGQRYGLVYAAAALHWTAPEGRWSRVAALLEPGGVFASFGGPAQLSDAAVKEAVSEARAPFMESDEVPSPDGTPPENAMQWPGTELLRSEWFTGVEQSVVEHRVTMSARDYVGLLSTISAYLVLPATEREQVFGQIMKVLPEAVEVTADVTVHLARRYTSSLVPAGENRCRPGPLAVQPLVRALSRARASSGVPATGTPGGTGGRPTTTTGIPASRAAVSLGAVASPPLSFVTRTSTRCRRISSRSPSSENGPRSSRTSIRAGYGSSGASTERIRNHSASRAANAARPMRPVVRKTRDPSPGSSSAAPVSESVTCHRSPSTGTQPGRRRASRGTWTAAAAEAALKLILPAKGWVASMTASTWCARSHSAMPSAPPKPPTRTSPGGSFGCATRPASELVTRNPSRGTRDSASRRASVVPPRTSTCKGIRSVHP